MKSRRRLVLFIVPVLLIVFAGIEIGTRARLEQERQEAARADDRAAFVERMGVVPRVLFESSGVAVSRVQDGVIWSHNDSGGDTKLYAMSIDGTLLAEVEVGGATARDWEGLEAGPCPAHLELPCLYIGDIGDNQRRYSTLTVYVMAEPRLEGRTADTPVPSQGFRYRYPDEPRDAEGLAVTSRGDVIIVTKGRSGSVDFFRMKHADVRRALATGTVLTAEHVGNTGIDPDFSIGRQVTGAAVAPNAELLVVRTYSEIYLYSLADSTGVWPRVSEPCWLGDLEAQGEAIDFMDDSTYVLTSEAARGRAGEIHTVRC